MEAAASGQHWAGRQPVSWSPCSQQGLLSPPGPRSPAVPGWEPPPHPGRASPGLVDLHPASHILSLCHAAAQDSATGGGITDTA